MEKLIRKIAGRKVTVCFSTLDCPTVIYVHMPGEEDSRLIEELAGEGIAIVCMTEVDWNRELPPWPAARTFRKGQDFSGEADSYLEELTSKIIPEVEGIFAAPPQNRGIAGYSLAGLFAVYGIYRTTAFNRVACVSGSLWYDGFIEFMEKHRPASAVDRVYFSIGDKEKASRNPRLSKVEECTVAAQRNLAQYQGEVFMEYNPGGHFHQVVQRMVKGIRWIANN